MVYGRIDAKFKLPVGNLPTLSGGPPSKKTGQQEEAQSAFDQAAARAFGFTDKPPRATYPRGGKSKGVNKEPDT